MSFSFNVFNDRYSNTSHMKQNLRQKEFLLYFKWLTEQSEQSSLSYKCAPFIELKKYADYLWDFFLWKYKNLYLELFISFINSSTSGDEFSEQFIKLRFSHIKKFDQLFKELEINFQAGTEFPVDSRAFGFNRIISQVYEDCEAFVSDECLKIIGDDRDVDEIDENELRIRIKETILRIQRMIQEN